MSGDANRRRLELIDFLISSESSFAMRSPGDSTQNSKHPMHGFISRSLSAKYSTLLLYLEEKKLVCQCTHRIFLYLSCTVQNADSHDEDLRL